MLALPHKGYAPMAILVLDSKVFMNKSASKGKSDNSLWASLCQAQGFLLYNQPHWAGSLWVSGSMVERVPDKNEVPGPIPGSPTIRKRSMFDLAPRDSRVTSSDKAR